MHMKRNVWINCRNTLPLEVVPLKIGTLGYAVSARSFFILCFKRRSSRYAAKWLRGYVAMRLRSYVATRLHRLKNELDSCVAFLFRLMDYCFGTLNKERIKLLCSALFSMWKNNHNVQKPRPRSYLSPSLASSRVAP